MMETRDERRVPRQSQLTVLGIRAVVGAVVAGFMYSHYVIILTAILNRIGKARRDAACSPGTIYGTSVCRVVNKAIHTLSKPWH